MNSSDLQKGQRVVDKQEGSILVVTKATNLDPVSETTYNGKKVSDSNTEYPESDPAVEVVYKSDVIENHEALDSDFSISDLRDYEYELFVHVERYYFPISRLTTR